MKFSFQFSNLLGTVYQQGNLLFAPDGTTVLSPVGNKITIFDLKNHRSETLPIESRFSYTTVALSPNGVTLIAVNEDGEVQLISLISRTILHRLRTNRKIHAVKFSPDSKHFAFTKENGVFVYKSPGPHTREYQPFVMERVLQGPFDETTCLTWSSCSRILAAGSADMTVRIYALEKFQNFSVCCLGGMTDPVVGAFFEKDSLDCYSVSRGGQLAIWESSLDVADLKLGELIKKKKKKEKEDGDEEDDIVEGNKEIETVIADENTSKETNRLVYKRNAKHFLRDCLDDGGRGCELTSADYHNKTKILVTGFSNGAFLLHSLPDVSLVHSLAISEQPIGAVVFNNTGDWIALGCPDLGQLLVWEWQSETYVLKQQGHSMSMTTLAYSPDGSLLATAGEDSKIKLWNTLSGFCFVTFSEHESGVTGLTFTPSGKVVLSSSLDGTVRAFDMNRYRNFKTFTSPRPVQFSCVAVDSSGDLVAAGGHDVFEVFLWSMTTGRLVEVLSGHEGPVGALGFSPSPTSSQLATVSWDKTLRVWDALASSGSREAVALGSDGLAVAWRPDGQELSVAVMAGQVMTFDARTSTQTGTIDGRKDLGAGKGETDKISAKNKKGSAAFTSLCYSADGTSLLAGGKSKNICIYHVPESLLLKKFEVTQNRSFDAMDETVNKRKMTEFGNLALIEDREDGTSLKLPGTKKADMSSRTFRPEVRVTGLRFSPSGRSFAATSTEGLLVYSLDRHLVFDPYELEMDITPQTIRRNLRACEFGRALVMALRLNEKEVIREVLEQVPASNVPLLVKDAPTKYIEKMLQFVAEEFEGTRHIEFYLKWTLAILSHHGPFVKENSTELMSVLNLLLKNLTRKSEDLGKVCDHNKYTIKYLMALQKARSKEKEEQEMDSDSEEEEDIDDVMDCDDEVGSDMEELAAKWTDDDDE